MSGPATIRAVILRHAKLRPNSPAVVATGFEPLSYRELGEYLALVSTRMRGAGLDRGSRVAVALPHSADAALAITAIVSAAVAVPIDTLLTAPEIERRLTLLRSRAVVAPADGQSVARDVAVRLGLPIIAAGRGGRGKLGMDFTVPQVGPAAAAEPPDAASPAYIKQTSGTSADPKLIPFSHANMLAAAERARSWFGLGPADRCLGVAPLCYGHGLAVTLFTPLITGGSVAFPARISPLDVAEWFIDLGPTWYTGGPSLHRFVLDKTKPLPGARSFHSLQFITSGGAPLPPDVRDGLMATLGVPVLEHYGCTRHR